jgi:hypothetical protein
MEFKSRAKGDSFEPQDFSATPLLANAFIPLIVNVQDIFSSEENLQLYYLPSFEKATPKSNTVKNIRDGFYSYSSFIKIRINERNYYFAKGIMFDQNKKPLMVCGMRPEAFLDSRVPKYTDSYTELPFSYNNFVMFYASEFLTDSSLAPLNRRLQKEILIPCFQKGIEVRMITSPEIEKNTFARLFEVKKTKSLTELDTYLNTKLKTFLYESNEDLLSEEVSGSVKLEELQSEELSIEEEALLWTEEESNSSDSIFGEEYFPISAAHTPAHTGSITVSGTGVGLRLGNSITGTHSTYIASVETQVERFFREESTTETPYGTYTTGIDPATSTPSMFHAGTEGMAQVERFFRDRAQAIRRPEPSIILIDDTE